MSEPHSPIQDIYKSLALFGVDPHLIKPDHRNDDDSGRVALALPDTKVALSILGDRVQPFIEDGWHVANLTMGEIQSFSKVFSAISEIAFENMRRESSLNQVKTGSKEEERLLAAILRANLPMPDRNYTVRKDDGVELTTPDFVWEELRVAFYMDGLWWHQTMDDRKMVDQIAVSAAEDPSKKRLLTDGERTRAQKDADNRSELASLGWIILVCTDADLETDVGVDKQVQRISQTLRNASKNQKKVNKESVEEVKQPDIQEEPAFDPFGDL